MPRRHLAAVPIGRAALGRRLQGGIGGVGALHSKWAGLTQRPLRTGGWGGGATLLFGEGVKGADGVANCQRGEPTGAAWPLQTTPASKEGGVARSTAPPRAHGAYSRCGRADPGREVLPAGGRSTHNMGRSPTQHPVLARGAVCTRAGGRGFMSVALNCVGCVTATQPTQSTRDACVTGTLNDHDHRLSSHRWPIEEAWFVLQRPTDVGGCRRVSLQRLAAVGICHKKCREGGRQASAKSWADVGAGHGPGPAHCQIHINVLIGRTFTTECRRRGQGLDHSNGTLNAEPAALRARVNHSCLADRVCVSRAVQMRRQTTAREIPWNEDRCVPSDGAQRIDKGVRGPQQRCWCCDVAGGGHSRGGWATAASIRHQRRGGVMR